MMNNFEAEDELAEVHTGNGYHADLEATQSKRIRLTVLHLRELESLTKKLITAQKDSATTTSKLVNVTETQGTENEKLQKRVYWLTWATVILAIVQVVVALVSLR